MADLLRVAGLSAGYGRAVVLSDVAFGVGEGQALAVLGRNANGWTEWKDHSGTTLDRLKRTPQTETP